MPSKMLSNAIRKTCAMAVRIIQRTCGPTHKESLMMNIISAVPMSLSGELRTPENVSIFDDCFLYLQQGHMKDIPL